MPLRIEPVTPDRWEDVLTLFGPSGAYSNCWCTWFVLTAGEWDDTPDEGRREILQGLVASGDIPGLLAYDGTDPVGWCAVGPRERYARMMSTRSRVYRPIDDRESWMINCFYIARGARGRGVAGALLAAAVDHARSHGATLVEGYPVDRDERDAGPADLYVGTRSMFTAAGFEEVSRVNARPLMRLELG